ncbi:hypothetical protein [Longispora albida]|uniref:hypothetical protein n=1 Tax=Longispora albida TaxID=203523 RepID=UPI0003688F4C|nr:hypothetical protein [Longispora albida]
MDQQPQPDASPGEIHFDEPTQSHTVTLPTIGRLWLISDDETPFVDLLPHARRIIAAFDQVHRESLAFLWSWGATGDETAEDQARFRDELRPETVTLHPSGAFVVHYAVTAGRHFPDGYWPAVHHHADLTPARVTVEA